MFANFFASTAIKVATGIVGALLLALALMAWRADTISDQRETARDDLATEKAQHAVTRASVDTLEAELARFVGAGLAARAAQIASLEAQKQDSALLQADADRIRLEIESFDASNSSGCRTSKAILDARGL
jgi:predicted negative regulator of RcsB-dependent stress response